MADDDDIPMPLTPPGAAAGDAARFSSELIERKERRKLKARRERSRSVWYHLGMFGLVGWSVALPTVAGTALGLWLEHHWKASFSWTLVGMGAGLAIGCCTAWYWVKREAFANSAEDHGQQQNAQQE
ncbi:MAG: hypothetical protein KatS3mg110_2285 [Pirellulaceae bacterium]|nr:MAG: hypothetical protein KatS3mg110_2285 [Pirellulaceae bacterium]